ncbi:hypothetical protein HK101_005141 [Irineochytrium annulatum]|nr:hypothetical protein HK101_005141 [Irineochytrium annulatum]
MLEKVKEEIKGVGKALGAAGGVLEKLNGNGLERWRGKGGKKDGGLIGVKEVNRNGFGNARAKGLGDTETVARNRNNTDGAGAGDKDREKRVMKEEKKNGAFEGDEKDDDGSKPNKVKDPIHLAPLKDEEKEGGVKEAGAHEEEWGGEIQGDSGVGGALPEADEIGDDGGTSKSAHPGWRPKKDEHRMGRVAVGDGVAALSDHGHDAAYDRKADAPNAKVGHQ